MASPFIASLLFLAAILLVAALVVARRGQFRLAWSLGLLLWGALGAISTNIETLATPLRHVSRLAPEILDSKDPFRWRGTLRSDPLKMPWGVRYEIELDQVEVAAKTQPICGGLRVSYFRNPDDPVAATSLRAGDRVEALVRARPPRNFQNPGAFDAVTNLARQGVHLTGTLRNLELLSRLDSPPPSLTHRAARARGFFLDRIDALFQSQPEQAAALRAILLGDYSFIGRDMTETFQRTSVYHVLVVSGLHFAVLAAFVFQLARRARLSLWTTSLLTLAVLGAFLAIVEDRPPIERAALMATLVLAAGLLFRKVGLLNTVGVSVALILAFRPSSLTDPSFQLSFLAGAMIGALGQPVVERTTKSYRDALAHLSDVTRDVSHRRRVTQFRLDLRTVAEWLSTRLPARLQSSAAKIVTLPFRVSLRICDVFLVSVVIQIGMLPLLAHYFHRVSLVGPVANIPAALLSAALVPVGLATLALDAVFPRMIGPLANLTSWLTQALLGSVSWFGQWRAASYRVPGPPLWVELGFFAGIILLTWILGRATFNGKLAASTGALLLLGATGLVICVYPFRPEIYADQMEATVLDVSQGDSIFLTFPNGQTMLLDGGGQYSGGRSGGFNGGLDIGEQVVSPYLWSRGVKHIDVVALSHAHLDHLEGLLAVLENFRVGELWIGRDVPSGAFTMLLAEARSKGLRIVHRKRGDGFSFGSVSGLVLWPEISQAAESASNNDSLVLRFTFGERTFLLPGDIEAPVEQELFLRDDPLAADFLKISHHGSRTSTTADFALAVLPRVAVISV
ncbi:MAG: ComEC/Rec2 family competence protein, partial [Acidobacteria bacterium]|nr:ComEC/Rec2 family competence protein [Acidobacteriota bacterium]